MVALKINCYPKSWRPKQHLNQNWYKLWAIYITIREGWNPLALLYHIDATSTSCVCHRVNIPWLANATSITSATNTSLMVFRTLKQTTQYNKYCIWKLKPRIQSKLSMALLETYQPWIISKSWYYIRKPISLCRIALFNADFHSCSIQAPLNTFAYPVQVIRITSARSSSRSSLAYTLRRIAPTPHTIMLRS